jgi:hypothetical protein
MSSNPNWPRWIFATASRHFLDAATAAGIPLFIEGQHRATRKEKDFFELRMDGPNLREVSKDCWILNIEFNILIQSTMSDTDYHRIHQNVGIAAAAFEPSISVFKLGKGIQDDQSFVGCLQLLQNAATRDYVEINHFGQIDVKTKLMQASVEGHYKMVLDTTS